VFIRAPVFEETGDGVDVLATFPSAEANGNGTGDRPVLVRSGRLLASSFHPELTDDLRLHRYFLTDVCGFPLPVSNEDPDPGRAVLSPMDPR
jgi:5'-phosphate synthase pdxT subunit